ncbi:MAG TPA: S8 family peptidase, partial [Polyangiaceae bacterium LLY-WYZ-15_(1-7)]|nr:S8 family peptidase [Polyangiaceae bacterium LLY-WYZ-15_(1-7)]
MRRWSALLVALALVGATVASLAVRQDEPAPEAEPTLAADPATGAVLIDLGDDLDASERDVIEDLVHDAIAPYAWPEGDAALGETLSESAQLFRITPPASELGDLRDALGGLEDVEALEAEREWSLPPSAEAFAIGELAAVDEEPDSARGPYRPNDPYYKHQWHLDQIQMPGAWQRSQGQGVVVAVIDTGVAYADAGRFRQAPDLKQTRMVAGRDFVDRDDRPFDEHGHGTHVAGTVAQSTNNGVGVAGVAPQAAIMPIRVLDRRGAGSWGNVAAGIRWAADHGADVINLSLGGGTPSRAIANAIAHAHRKGVVVVAAAGNTGRGRVQYPAAHRYAFAVGAVRYDETLSFYSSYGRHLDVVAPGGDLRVDQNGDGLPDGVLQNTIVRGNVGRHDYLAFQGTSMAAPHVAGAAALLKASGVSDPSAVQRLLRDTAKSKSDTRRYGAGLIQADDALRAGTRDLGAARGFG